MKTLHFSKTIDAPREKVWDTLLESDTYTEWTSPFMEGSYFKGSWNKGEQIRFLAPDGSGMLSVIEENRPHEFISIKHIGEVRNGVDDLDSESVRKWAPAFENYTLTSRGRSTEFKVDVDVTPEYEHYMQEKWPVALDKLKSLSEAS